MFSSDYIYNKDIERLFYLLITIFLSGCLCGFSFAVIIIYLLDKKIF